MKIASLVTAAFVVAVGGSGAVVAYVSAASPTQPAHQVPVAARQAYDARPAPLRPRPVRYRPCAAGSRLEHGKCVRHVVRTVTVPTAPTTAAAQPSSPTATTPRRAVTRPRATTATATREHESEPGETENDASEPPEPGDD